MADRASSQQALLQLPATVTASFELPDAPQVQAPAKPAPPKTNPAPSNPDTLDSQARTASLHGTVTSSDGSVYEGAHISLSLSSGPSRSATSGSDGQFRFDNLAAGEFHLSVSASGFNSQTVSGHLRPGESYEVPPIVLPISGAMSEVRVTLSEPEIAEEQLHIEEQQRVFGAIPNFYVVYDPHPAALSAKQKFHLAFRNSFDPVNFILTGLSAGVEQATDTYPGYGQGAEGYAKRYGAAYADGFISNMIGGAILPSLLKQDPRYFYKGTGSIKSRAWYAIESAVITHGDNGRRQFDYSGILGGLAASGISNLYYPESDRNGAGLTFQNLAIGTAATAGANLFQEFLVKKLTPHVPKHNPSNP